MRRPHHDPPSSCTIHICHCCRRPQSREQHHSIQFNFDRSYPGAVQTVPKPVEGNYAAKVDHRVAEMGVAILGRIVAQQRMDVVRLAGAVVEQVAATLPTRTAVTNIHVRLPAYILTSGPSTRYSELSNINSSGVLVLPLSSPPQKKMQTVRMAIDAHRTVVSQTRYSTPHQNITITYKDVPFLTTVSLFPLQTTEITTSTTEETTTTSSYVSSPFTTPKFSTPHETSTTSTSTTPSRTTSQVVSPSTTSPGMCCSTFIVGVGLMNCTCLAATPTITFFYVDGLTDYVRNTSKPFISPFFRKNPRAKPVFVSFFSRKLIVFEFVQAHDGLGFSYCACSWYQIFV